MDSRAASLRSSRFNTVYDSPIDPDFKLSSRNAVPPHVPNSRLIEQSTTSTNLPAGVHPSLVTTSSPIYSSRSLSPSLKPRSTSTISSAMPRTGGENGILKASSSALTSSQSPSTSPNLMTRPPRSPNRPGTTTFLSHGLADSERHSVASTSSGVNSASRESTPPFTSSTSALSPRMGRTDSRDRTESSNDLDYYDSTASTSEDGYEDEDGEYEDSGYPSEKKKASRRSARRTRLTTKSLDLPSSARTTAGPHVAGTAHPEMIGNDRRSQLPSLHQSPLRSSSQRGYSSPSSSSALVDKGKAFQPGTGLGLKAVVISPDWDGFAQARERHSAAHEAQKRRSSTYASDLGSGISSQTSSSRETSPLVAQSTTSSISQNQLTIPDFGSPPSSTPQATARQQSRSARFLPEQVQRHERGSSTPHNTGRYRSTSAQDIELQPDHIVFPTATPSPARRSRSPSSISSRRSSVTTSNTPIFSIKSHATTNGTPPFPLLAAKPSSLKSSSVRSETSGSQHAGRSELSSGKLYFPPPPPKISSPTLSTKSSLVFPSAPRRSPHSSPASSQGPFPVRSNASSPNLRANAFPRALAANMAKFHPDDGPVFPAEYTSVRSASDRERLLEDSISEDIFGSLNLRGSTKRDVFPTTSPARSTSNVFLTASPSLSTRNVFPTVSPSGTLDQRRPSEDELGDELDLMMRAQSKVAPLAPAPRIMPSTVTPAVASVYDDILGEGENAELKGVAEVDLSSARIVSPNSDSLKPRSRPVSSRSILAEEVQSPISPNSFSRQRTTSSGDRSSIYSDETDYHDAPEFSPRQSIDLDDMDRTNGTGQDPQPGVIPWLSHSVSYNENLRRMSMIGEEAEEDAIVEDGERKSPKDLKTIRTSPRNSKNLTILPPNDLVKEIVAVDAITTPVEPVAMVSQLAERAQKAGTPAPAVPATRPRTPSTPSRPFGSLIPSTPTGAGRSMYTHSNSSSLSTQSHAPSLSLSTRSARSFGRRIGNIFNSGGGTSSTASSPRQKTTFGSKNGSLNMVGISSDDVRAAGLFQDDAAEVLSSRPNSASVEGLGGGSSTSGESSLRNLPSGEVSKLEGLFARFEMEEKERLKEIAAAKKQSRPRSLSSGDVGAVLA